jgi:hypothetical protein
MKHLLSFREIVQQLSFSFVFGEKMCVWVSVAFSPLVSMRLFLQEPRQITFRLSNSIHLKRDFLLLLLHHHLESFTFHHGDGEIHPKSALGVKLENER